MISTGNDAVHNVVGGEDVKNIENSKYKTRQELFTKLNGSSCQFRIPLPLKTWPRSKWPPYAAHRICRTQAPRSFQTLSLPIPAKSKFTIHWNKNFELYTRARTKVKFNSPTKFTLKQPSTHLQPQAYPHSTLLHLPHLPQSFAHYQHQHLPNSPAQQN